MDGPRKEAPVRDIGLTQPPGPKTPTFSPTPAFLSPGGDSANILQQNQNDAIPSKQSSVLS